MADKNSRGRGLASGRGIAFGAFLVLGIILAGCGDGERTDAPATTAAVVVTTAPPTELATTTAAPATSPPTTRRATTTTRKPTPTTHRRPPTTRKPPQTTSAPARNCDPAYPDACLHDGIGDYDCAGGSGNGPNYVEGPITVRAPDPFGLDSDHDGVGCES
ncbi:MAG TPA: hypothetical protein VE776_08860 [Actinomycetota bacterium]|nr:hypothetical protein [Actinomycetota bacterium]